MNIVKKSLKYPQVTISVLLLTLLVGVYSLLYMPRREDPKIDVRVGQVIAYYPGASSLQVEEQVSRKLEQYLFQYKEVKKEKTRSTTRDGVVIIDVYLHDDVPNLDTFWSKLNHQLLVLKAVNLPSGVRGPFVNYEFGDTEALVTAMEMDHPDYAQLREYTQRLEDSLKTLKAVSKIKRIGEQKEQLVITSNSAKLDQYGITFAKIMQVLQSQNDIGPTGDVKTPDAKITLYSRGYYKTEAQIADQIIGTARTGQVARLKDVANIERQYQEPSSKVLVNGRNTMLLAVQMHEGNNIIEFGKAVDKKLDETAKLLPSGVKLTTIVNQPKIVDKNVSNFMREFIMAIIAVIVIIVLLLPLRVAAVAAMAIPMTIAVTFALMHALGIELHQVSLASLILVLGMVVDDAVVVADNYVELLDRGVDRQTAAWKSATELVVPILAADAIQRRNIIADDSDFNSCNHRLPLLHESGLNIPLRDFPFGCGIQFAVQLLRLLVIIRIDQNLRKIFYRWFGLEIIIKAGRTGADKCCVGNDPLVTFNQVLDFQNSLFGLRKFCARGHPQIDHKLVPFGGRKKILWNKLK